tara:strand:+ start:488 stop:754 length:267 start_codon:yes stop_codon:yes gene_type:complete
MAEKSTFHETKEITTRLHEPLKFSVKAYKTQKESGHYIEFTFNVNPFGVDTIDDVSGPVVIGIEKCKKVIEGPLESTYLGAVRIDENT